MTQFCTITPTRNDRPEFDEFCKHQLSRMKVKPDHSYFINYEPKSKDKDLTQRVKFGVELAKKDGFEKVFIIENDDWYSENYFNRPDAQFVGFKETHYYNIMTERRTMIFHQEHSCLFNLSFDISALEGFLWPNDREPYLDLALWKQARKKARKRILMKLSDMPECIGIKHGIGLAGGKGHRMKLKRPDPGMEWLKERIDSDSFEFYKKLKL